jgi:hypothetical protein
MSNYKHGINVIAGPSSNNKTHTSETQSNLAIWLGGKKYYVIDRNESENVVYLRGEECGICLMKTNQCIVVGVYKIDDKLFCKNVGKLNRKVFKFGTMLKKFLF